MCAVEPHTGENGSFGCGEEAEKLAPGVEAGVNVTVGLPVIRTPVAHGTAFDVAGTGRVEVGGMREALRQATESATAPVTSR